MKHDKNSKQNYFTRYVLPIAGGLAVGGAIVFGAMKYNQKNVTDSYTPSVELGHTIDAPMISSPVNQFYVDKTSNVVITGNFNVGNNSGNAEKNVPTSSNVKITNGSLDVVVNDSLVMVKK
ncbi:hypothetical protein JXA48_04985 [Candidatus Woesearchaeota archaeon]|nr:hypothetical protein [Candidatus Woesearchaeota archaeon]